MDKLEELRLFTLKIRPAYTNVVRQADESLGDAFDANARVLDDPEEIEVSIKSSKETRQGALARLRNPFKWLARRNDLRENATQFEVKGKHEDTNRVQTIDSSKGSTDFSETDRPHGRAKPRTRSGVCIWCDPGSTPRARGCPARGRGH